MGRRDSRLATYGRAAAGASVITRLPDLLGPYPLNGFCRFQKDRRLHRSWDSTCATTLRQTS